MTAQSFGKEDTWAILLETMNHILYILTVLRAESTRFRKYLQSVVDYPGPKESEELEESKNSEELEPDSEVISEPCTSSASHQSEECSSGSSSSTS